MRRTFNFTGRQIIPEDDIRISLRRNNGSQTFDADLSFDGVTVPDDAAIYVEAYFRTSFMRFAWGEVGAPNPPPDRTLDDFPGQGTVFFRVKVVDTSTDHGRILARRESISPRTGDEDGEEPEGKRSLLPVRYDPELGDEVWRISIDPRPVLEVNTKEGDVDVETLVKKDGGFAALVFHEALRRVLLQVLVVGETPPLNEIREMEGWQSDWLRFAEQIYRDSAPDPEESEVGEIIYWIDAVASRYCSKIDAHSRFVESFSN